MSANVPSVPAKTNRHFMNAVVNLAETQEIALSEDIYSEKGVKLLARGAKVSPEMYAKIVSHKLVKPIEVCIAAAEPPSGAMFVRIAEDLLDELPLLAGISNWSLGRVTPSSMLFNCKISASAGTLLAVALSRSDEAPRHMVMTALIAMGIANACRYNDPPLLTSMCIGGLFHDVGELYVDPAVMGGGKLTATEWMSYAGHPIIGAALAREVCGFDVATQRAILEHHEYSDGFGYPRSLRGHAISTGGRILALAEVLSALLQNPSAYHRIDIALKIMPGEHDPELVSVVSELLRKGRSIRPEKVVAVDDDVSEKIHSVFLRIADVLEVYDDLTAPSATTSKPIVAILEEVYERFAEVQKAFASTGVSGLSMIDGMLEGDELDESRFEAQCVFHEIAWRLQKLSRELVLKAGKMLGPDAGALMRMADALAGTSNSDTPQVQGIGSVAMAS